MYNPPKISILSSIPTEVWQLKYPVASARGGGLTFNIKLLLAVFKLVDGEEDEEEDEGGGLSFKEKLRARVGCIDG